MGHLFLKPAGGALKYKEKSAKKVDTNIVGEKQMHRVDLALLGTTNLGVSFGC